MDKVELIAKLLLSLWWLWAIIGGVLALEYRIERMENNEYKRI